jgi:SAM-dependent methyltransferase
MTGDLFDDIADKYDRELAKGISISGESKEYFAQERVANLVKLLSPQFQPRHIMDYGCGTGGSIPYLVDRFKPDRLIGVDVSKASLAYAQKNHLHPRVSFKTIAAFEEAHEVDLVYCNGVFHHIAPEQRTGAIKFVADALKPGGYFALWENNPWSLATRLVMSRTPFDRDAILVWPREAVRLLESAGFAICKVRFFFIFPSFLGLLRPLEKWVSYFPFGAQYVVLARKLDS